MSAKMKHDFASTLAEIRDSSEKFSEAASAATKEVEALEAQLLEIEPGVSVWTDQIAETSEDRVGEDGQPQAIKKVVKLGFAKLKKWGIAVSEEVFDESGKRISREQALLRKSDRDLRLLGAAHLGDLLDALKGALATRLAALPQSKAESDGPAELEVEIPTPSDETQAA